ARVRQELGAAQEVVVEPVIGVVRVEERLETQVVQRHHGGQLAAGAHYYVAYVQEPARRRLLVHREPFVALEHAAIRALDQPIPFVWIDAMYGIYDVPLVRDRSFPPPEMLHDTIVW